MIEIKREMINGIEYRTLSTLKNARYQVEYFLAAGGQGITLVARDKLLADNRVLVKAPLYGDALGLGAYNFREEKLKRRNALLKREVPNVINLNNTTQNVPRLVDVFEDQNAMLVGRHPLVGGNGETWEIQLGDDLARDVFLVYELLSAGAQARARTLEDVLRQQGCLDELGAVRLAHQLSEVLYGLHRYRQLRSGPATSQLAQDEAGEDDWDDFFKDSSAPAAENYFYIYQDLKPANILAGGESLYFLIDFGGLSRCEDTKNQANRYRVDDPSGVFTLGYAPPEFFVDPHTISHHFDIFSLGAILFQCLSGVHPANLLPEDSLAAGNAAPSFYPNRIKEKAPSFKPSRPLVEKIVLNATQEKPWYRYKSMREMREDLARVLEEA